MRNGNRLPDTEAGQRMANIHAILEMAHKSIKPPVIDLEGFVQRVNDRFKFELKVADNTDTIDDTNPFDMYNCLIASSPSQATKLTVPEFGSIEFISPNQFFVSLAGFNEGPTWIIHDIEIPASENVSPGFGCHPDTGVLCWLYDDEYSQLICSVSSTES